MSRPGFAQGWRRFWFEPQSTSTLAIFRIVFGTVVTLWFATLAPTLLSFFGPRSAMIDRPPLGLGAWTVFTVVGDNAAVVIVFWLVALLGAVALALGFLTRLAAVIVFVALVSFDRQMPLAINAGDMLLRQLSFFLMLAPSGAALSVDRWRSAPSRFWDSPRRAPWALRMMQIQLSVIYISTVWEKVQGMTWRQGTALSYALRLTDLQRLPTPAFVTDSLWLVQLITFGTLALELAIGVLAWNRAARPWVLSLGVLLHVSIDLTIAVGFFSAAMLTLYLTFLSPHAADGLTAAVRAQVERRRSAGTTRKPAGSASAAAPPGSTAAMRSTVGRSPSTEHSSGGNDEKATTGEQTTHGTRPIAESPVADVDQTALPNSNHLPAK